MISKSLKQSLALVLATALTALPAVAQTAAPAPDQNNQQPAKPALEDKFNPLLIGKRNINKGQVDFYSLEKEAALGRQLAAEVDRESKFVTDPSVIEYVNRVGQNLALNSDAKVPFTIKVIDSTDVNAFALPGGFLYVNRGVIEAADSEAELAGVMAHEIAHVAARHGVEQASKGQLLNYASIPLIFFGGGIGYAIQQAASIAVPLTFLKFSRGAEKEADLLGAQYLWAAGYDPNAMLSFFEKLQRKDKSKPGTIARVFSTHPLTGDRIKEVHKLLERLPERTEYAISGSEFKQVRDHLIALAGPKTIPGAENNGRPTLKRRPSSTQPTDDPASSSPDRERPTLKRGESTDIQTDENGSGQTVTPDRPTLKRRTDTGN